MSFTSLTLGANWEPCECPEYVLVSHEGVGDELRYLPDRVCRYVVDEFGGECSECWGVLSPLDSYCPKCGARVVGRCR